MVGTLLWMGCERSERDSSHVLELWAYPDGTLNLVANKGAGLPDCTFPVCFEQLEGVLAGHALKLFGETSEARVERLGDRVCASYRTSDFDWTHCVPIADYQSLVADARSKALRL